MPEIAHASRSLSLVDDLLAPEDAWRRSGKENGGGDEGGGGGGGGGGTGDDGRAGSGSEPSSPSGVKTAKTKPARRAPGFTEAATSIVLGVAVVLLGAALGWADLTSGSSTGLLRELAIVSALLLVSHGVLMLITATEEKKHDSAARERTGLLLLGLGLLLALSTLGHDPAAALTVLSYVSAFVLFGLGYILLVRRPVAR